MAKHDNLQKIFEKRSAYAFFLFISICLFSVLRISVISSSSEYANIRASQSIHRITIKRNRGTIYDTNMIPLTNNKREEYVAIPPTADAIMDVPLFLFGEEKTRVLNELKQNKVAYAKPSGKVSAKSIVKTYIYSNDENNYLAEHIIGYTDNSGRGVCGIEKAYDELLFCEKTVDILYEVNGKGNLLYGNKPTFENDLSCILNGVRLTIDSKIQEIAEDCSNDLEKGACIVCEATSGKIRAILSKPSFSPFKIEESLNADNSPMLNRAITAFSVGSVFKPCVAIAGIESGNKEFLFNCTGKTNIENRDFSCHEKSGHGMVDLKNAICYSCNTFFYNYGISVGAEKILRTASMLNFGSRIKLGENYYTDSGNLTDIKKIYSDSSVANLSIGQGDLMLTPVALLSLYMSIANGGTYITPSIVESTVICGEQTPYKASSKTKVMEKSTAEFLKEALKKVVTDGTGMSAKSEKTEVAGKTATAQTGRYSESGKEITNSWFCGFFPAESPKYVVVLMADGESKVSMSEIFRRIAEKIVENP